MRHCTGGADEVKRVRAFLLNKERAARSLAGSLLVYGMEVVIPVINCCFSAAVSWAEGCRGV
jgi:hypothetical protein